MGLLVPPLPSVLAAPGRIDDHGDYHAPTWAAVTSYKLELNTTPLRSPVIKCAYCGTPVQTPILDNRTGGSCLNCGGQLPVGVK